MINYDYLMKEVVSHRRALHRIPEIGFFVYKTNSYIRSILSEFSCTVEECAKTGLVAFFDFGKPETICFRADMDGLPIEEETGLDFSSTHEGCMHACGHDGHMANLLGFARIVNDHLESETDVNYNALLLFQPAEETIDGAISIIDSHVFEKYNVKRIFGLHVWPYLEKGEIATKPGVMMAKSTAIAIDVEGLSAHCGDPGNAHDALEAACSFVHNVYKYKNNHVRERSVLKFGKFESGTVRNIISDHTRIDGTMRTFDDATNKKLHNAMRHYAKQAESVYKVKFNIDTSKYHPAVINDEDLYSEIKDELLANHLNFVELRRPSMIAEDFSFFEEEIPGVFFFLGTGTGIPLHANDFNFDEAILEEGLKLFDTLFTEAI